MILHDLLIIVISNNA